MKAIILHFVKTQTGVDALTGAELSFSVKEPWPMLLDPKTGDCYYAVNAKSKGKILNTKAQIKLWETGSFYANLNS